MGSFNSRTRIHNSISNSSKVHFQCQKDHSSKGQASSLIGRGRSDVRQKCNRRSRSNDSRLLFDIFPSTQEGWRSATSSQPQGSKQIFSGQDIQDADTKNGVRPTPPGRLAGFIGSERRLLSCSNFSQTHAIPSFRISGQSVSIQGATLRSLDRSKGVHQGLSTHRRHPTSDGYLHLPLSGRLSDSGQIRRPVTQSSPVDSIHSGQCRVSGQLQEVPSQAGSNNSIPGDGDRHYSCKSYPSNRKSFTCRRMPSAFLASRRIQASQAVVTPIGSLGSDAPHGALCSSVHATHSVVPQCQMESQGLQHELSSYGSSALDSNISVVGRFGPFDSRSSMVSAQAIRYDHHRCVSQDVGCSFGGQEGTGSLDITSEISPHQCVGAPSCAESSQSVPFQGQEQVGLGSNRQYDGSQLYQQVGRDQIPSTLSDHLGLAELVHHSQDSAAGSSHSRGSQHSGRPALTEVDPSHGVGVERSGGSAIISNMAETHDRSVCHRRKQKVKTVLFADSSSSGGSPRCFTDELEQPLCLRISPSGHSQFGASEGGSGPGSPVASGSGLDQERMVPSSPESQCRNSLSSSDLEGHSDTASRKSASSQSSRVLTRGMVSKRNALLAQGLSRSAVDTCLASKSESTQRNYQSGWNHFSAWCTRYHIDPDESTVSQIVDYLNALLREEHKSYYTAKSRISAIAFFHPGHTFHGTSLGTHGLVRRFFGGAKKKFPPRRDLFPSWDLPTVLNALMGPPFEPLDELPLSLLTRKTLFLLAVCSAGRMGELQALDCRPPYCSIGAGGVVLKTHSSFVPKVPTAENIEKVLQFSPYGIDEAGLAGPENALCVCRALQEYLERTKEMRTTNQLFVTFKEGDHGRAAGKITMASWFKSLVQKAYISVNLPPPDGVKAHSARHQSASWADLKAVSVLIFVDRPVGRLQILSSSTISWICLLPLPRNMAVQS